MVKVADLGLARLATAEANSVTASLTQAGNILGTADYIAPNRRWTRRTSTTGSTSTAWAARLFFLLAGRPMYSAGSLMALLLKHRDAPIPSLFEARPDVPAELDAIYRRMAAKKPEDRYATMALVVRALEGVRKAVNLSETTQPAASAAGARERFADQRDPDDGPAGTSRLPLTWV